VFDKKNITIKELTKILASNFKGYEYLQHELIYQTPKYGNDNDYADENAVKVFDFFYDAVNGRPTPRGGKYRINLLPTTCHVYFGSVMGATPDGRNKGMPVSEGISPVQGADRKGPTAVINSCAKLDHIRTGGTLLNQKFTPEFLKDDDGISKVASLVRSYFRMDGHHIQFNVVNADTLRDAQKHPEKHMDLIVRVAGYSDYFNDLTPELQEEIISRTAHGEV
jgi:formate C-acetyltransferase